MIFDVGWTEIVVLFVGVPLLVGLLVLIRFWMLAYWGISERISLQRQSLRNQTEIINLLAEIKERLPENETTETTIKIPPRNPITGKQ